MSRGELAQTLGEVMAARESRPAVSISRGSTLRER